LDSATRLGKDARIPVGYEPARSSRSRVQQRPGHWFCAPAFLSLLTAGAALAGATNYHVKQWSDAEGLPQNWVECLLATRDGQLLVGTRVGLFRFDGEDFVPAFPDPVGQRLLDLVCTTLLEDPEGCLWIGTKRGLVQWAAGELRLFDKQNGMGGGNVECLTLAREGGLWVGTSHGIARWNGKQFVHHPPPTPDAGLVHALLEDDRALLWIGSSAGLDQFDPARQSFSHLWTAARTPTGDPGHGVESLVLDANGRLWFGTRGGVGWVDTATGTLHPPPRNDPTSLGNRQGLMLSSRWGLWYFGPGGVRISHGGEWVVPSVSQDMDKVVVRSAIEDLEGNLWLGTANDGLWRIRAQAARAASLPSGLSHIPTWSTCPAREGGLWVGTDRGLVRLLGNRSEQVQLEPSVSEISLRCVLETRRGDLWLGSAEQGLFRYTRHGPTFHSVPTRSMHHQVQVLCEDRSGAVWIGMKRGLMRVAPAAHSPDVLPKPNQGDLYSEEWHFRPHETWCFSDGQSWVGRDGLWHQSDSTTDTALPLGQLRTRSDTRWALDLPEGKLLDWDIRALLEDRHQALWIGTLGGGLHRLAHGRFEAWGLNHGLGRSAVFALYEDDTGTLWLGTPRGLTRIRDGRCFHLGDAHGLPNSLVNQILDDRNGHLWLGSHSGLTRVRRDELNAVADGHLQQVRAVVLTRVDGMPSNEINGQLQPGGTQTPDGRLWFPTTHGLAVVDPTLLGQPPEPAPVLFSSIRATDHFLTHLLPPAQRRSPARTGTHGSARANSPAHPITLPAGSGRSIEFQYVSANLTAPETTRYRHMLEGYDRDWIDAQRRKNVTYVNLRPGNYRFRVLARNRHGTWTEQAAECTFVLPPRWHQSLWAQIGAIGLLGAAIGGFHRWRFKCRLQLQQFATENRLAGERSRIGRDLHDDLGAWLARAQILVGRLRHRPTSAEDWRQPLAEVEQSLRASQQAVREAIWTLNPANDTLESLAARIAAFGQEYLEPLGVRCRLDLPMAWPAVRINAELRQSLLSAAKEATLNAVQHGKATEVQFTMRIHQDSLRLRIADNGCGMPAPAKTGIRPPFAANSVPDPTQSSDNGNGLRNLRRRVEALGGQLEWSAAPTSGTVLHLQLPLPL
jgi:ligand-binding sensor domain-containing protein/signal transduction histidine kinase